MSFSIHKILIFFLSGDMRITISFLMEVILMAEKNLSRKLLCISVHVVNDVEYIL